ncbi:hypothetical protein DH2020_016040 [Rehmannia glutinosa]|uniref:Uncharacterized protein n=1 Tax=Rehmannia glutinosa TaxID=99300 RepID=A0ABR0WUC8_REHGL
MDGSLSKFFEGIIEWSKEYNETKIHWSEPHLSVILSYALKLGLNFDSGMLISYALFCDNEHWHRRLEPDNYKAFTKLVLSFTQDLEELFVVPKLCDHEDKTTLKKNEVIAGFISFLVQLLYHKTALIVSFEDQVDRLQNELRFFVTVLGDTSILLEQVHHEKLLAEFEAVANEAGSVVHSFIFSMDRDFKAHRLDKALGVLLGHTDLLKANIIKFLNLMPFLNKGNMMYTKTAAVDSLFIVDSFLCDLEDLMNRKDDLVVDLMDQIKILYQGLMRSQSFINVLKGPQYSEIEERVKRGVMVISDVAYEAEYLINSYLVGDAPIWYLTIRLPDVIHEVEIIGNDLEEIKKTYNDTGAQKVAQHLNTQLSLQDKRNYVVDDIVVGFEDETVDILSQLVGGTEPLQLISIIGMPGLGKTTLAKKLYNHPTVNYRFDKRSWCVVSQTFEMKSLLSEILISLASEFSKDRILAMGEGSLVEHIYKSLKGRRYLIVMDDIWDSNVWNDLRRCFPNDGNGSRILFTSRQKNVAPPDSIIHEIPFLSNDQSWELLKKKVFHNTTCPPELLQIGKEIAANCGGLPLAIVVVAGILSTMDNDESSWKNVGGSLPSYILGDRDNFTMRILDLSYKNLPNHLKPCFLYFGAFLDYKEIPARNLMGLWIAEGFIRKEERKSAESVAEEYLAELIDKSLVIVAKRRSDGGVKACGVHDLFRDLCMKISAEENFLKLVVDDNYTIYEKGHRLLSFQRSLNAFSPHLRSFHGYQGELPFYVLNMKLLRVLNFEPLLCLAHLIGTEYLVHLRYLVINHFPPSIDSLVNLEYLRVQTTNKIFTIFAEVLKIPLEILMMVKLKYLQVIPRANYDTNCNTSGTNNIEFLSNYFISDVKDEEMLKCTPYLRKLKCYFPEPLRTGTSEYRYPDLCFLTQLESLKLTTHHRILIGVKIAEINFPSNIKKLTLNCLRLPWEETWKIGRLPNLEVLKLGSSAFVGKTWETRDGEFQKLRFLKLHGPSFTDWITSSEHFPRLQSLVLKFCEDMVEIPSCLGYIPTLQTIQVYMCHKRVVESAEHIQEEQRDNGNEELKFIITGECSSRFRFYVY